MSQSHLENILLTDKSAFAALAFFGGTIYNRVGIKVCLMFGGFGYACLSSAYFLTAHIGDRATGWIVAAGCIEGLSAAMVWTFVQFAGMPNIALTQSSSGLLKVQLQWDILPSA